MTDLDGYRTPLTTPGLEPRTVQPVACRYNNNYIASFIIVDKPIKKTYYVAKYLNVEHVIKYSYVQTKGLTRVLGEKQVTYKHNRPKNKFNKRATNMTGM
jgi:hypothetical protein